MEKAIPISTIDDDDKEISSASSLSADDGSDASLDSFLDQASVVVSAAVSSASDGSSGLPRNTLKQLIQDIHDQGGLDSELFNLETICLKKTDVYGKTEAQKGTKFQQQRIRSVQNKVGYWKTRKGRANYNKTLALYPPQNSSARKKSSTKKKKKTSTTPPRHPTSSGKKSSLAQSNEVVEKSRPFRPNPPSFSLELSEPTPSTSTLRTITMTKSYGEQLLETVEHVNLPVTIFPDGKETTQHLFGPFYVNKTESKVVNNQTVHDGYHIEVKDQDLRWINSEDEEEAFAAWHVRTNQVLIRKPEPSYSFWKEPKEEEEARKVAKYDDERIIESYNVSRNAVTKDTSNMYRYYLLTFTEAKLGLANEILSPNSEDGQLDVDVHLVQSEFEVQTSAGTNTAVMHRCNIVWDIASKEKVPRFKQESGKKKNRLNAKLIASVEGMKII